MNCYYHFDKPAIGLCKYCQRGLCSDCAAHAGDSLACKNLHEEQVRAMEALMQRNILQSKRVGSDYLAQHNFLWGCWNFVHRIRNFTTQLAGVTGGCLRDDRTCFVMGGSGELFREQEIQVTPPQPSPNPTNPSRIWGGCPIGREGWCV
jgi:hypothetical protein